MSIEFIPINADRQVDWFSLFCKLVILASLLVFLVGGYMAESFVLGFLSIPSLALLALVSVHPKR